MRTPTWLPVSLLALTLAAAAPARAAEHGSFGIGVNTSMSLSLNGGGGEGNGFISFRYWLSKNFAIDPQFGLSVLQRPAADNANDTSTTLGFLAGSRFLYSVVNAKNLRFNIGGEFLFGVTKTGGADAGVVMLFGFLAGVEYFLSKNVSLETYFGLPFSLVVNPITLFNMRIGGNVIAGFHYYF